MMGLGSRGNCGGEVGEMSGRNRSEEMVVGGNCCRGSSWK